MKLLSKHKFFIILLFSLVLLAIGSFFVIHNKATDLISADTFYCQITYKAYWGNGKTGKFISSDGNEFDNAVGSISCTTSGWSEDDIHTWSGGGSNTTYSSSSTTIKYSVSSNNWFGKYFGFSIALTPSASTGFSLTNERGTKTASVYSDIIGEFDNPKSESFEYQAYFTPNSYTIYFNANGGTLTGASSTSVSYYNNYKLSTATKTGYTLEGWYTAKSGGNKITSSTCKNTTGNETLYAHWTPNQYNVEFNRNIATGTHDKDYDQYTMSGLTKIDNIEYDSKYPTPINIPKRNGYTFAGFNTTASGEGTRVYNSIGVSSATYTTAGDQILYARWSANKIKIVLDLQLARADGKTLVSDTINNETSTKEFWYKYDTNKYFSDEACTIELNFQVPSKVGYTFGGYWTGTGGGGTQYITASGAFVNTPSENIYANSTLYAKWIEHTYTIKFNPNGGSGTMADIPDILYSASQKLTPNAFYRYGYLFKGWAKNAVAVDANVGYLDQDMVSSLTDEDDGEVILYAVWEKTWAVDRQTPSGAGTQANPYLISTPQHLGWMAYQTETQNLRGYFKQTAHISLSNETWLPIGNATYKFIENYDGNNYVITGLTTTETRKTSSTGNYKYSYQGLFGVASNATIDNVKVLSGTIRGNNYTGGIVGYAYSSTKLTNCQVGSVSIYANGNYNGGIAGYFNNASATACYSKAQMSGGGYYGGIGGYIQSTTLTACAFEGTLAVAAFGYQIGYSTGTSTKLYDCFAKTEKGMGFVGGSFTKDSCLYMLGTTTKKYYSGNFTNWVITTTNTPMPQGLSWLATGGTKVTSVNDITALGYTKA